MNTAYWSKLKTWEKVGEEIIIAKANGLTLYNQMFREPDSGEILEYSLFSKREGITVCAVTTDGNLVLVREYKQGANTIITGFPAGLFDPQDGSARQTALRELMEETGYKPTELKLYEPMYIAPRKSACKEWPAIALGCKHVENQRLDIDEGSIEVIEIKKNDFFNLIQEKKIITSEATMATAFIAHLNHDI